MYFNFNIWKTLINAVSALKLALNGLTHHVTTIGVENVIVKCNDGI